MHSSVIRLSKLLSIAIAATLLVVCLSPLFSSRSAFPFMKVNAASTVSFTESGGWMEAAYAEWSPVDNASGYNVYVKSASSSSYTQIDSMLIRQYSGYYRADAMALPAGSYNLKVVPVISGKADESKAAVTPAITVTAHTREGFAFSSSSPARTGSGGHADNGAVGSGGTVIYVTDSTKDSVKLNVITSSSGKVTSCTGISEIMTARQKGYDTSPLVIRLVGKVTAPAGINSNGYLQVKGCSNVTIEGVGEDAVIYGWALLIRSATNVEVSNLALMLFPDDGVSIDTDNSNIWIHNCDFFYGTAGGDADQAKGDGSLDLKKSNYITLSFNHFWDSGKSCLCGMSESSEYFVTYHHNWFDHSDSRHPRVRVGTIHVYNNYYDGIAKYGVGATTGSSIFVEANYFRNCKYPMLISLQGNDVSGDGEGTFSGEDGGMIKAYNNTVIGATGLTYHTDSATNFDAYLATSQKESVPSSVVTLHGGTRYNNFDTSSSMYSYKPDSPDKVVEILDEYSGRMHGGDFGWTFTNADDTDYSINTGLMSAIKAYKSSIVSIGSGSYVTPDPDPPVTTTTTSTSGGETGTTTTTSLTPIVEGDYVHNFTENDLNSSFYSFIGNLSTGKGTMTYGNLTLTQCLKMESTTEVKFTTTSAATITIVVKDGTSIKLDAVSQTIPADGVLTIPIQAGSHVITKGDGASNVFYISTLVEGGSSSVIYGDVNCDGNVDIRDVAMLAKAASAVVTLSDEARKNADVKNDTIINIQDVAVLAKYVSGSITSLPV